MNPKQKKDGKIAKITLRTLRCRGNTRKDVKKYFCWCRSEGCCCCSVVSACVLFFSVCVFLFVCFLFCWRAILSWHDQDTCTDALLGSISSFDKHLFYVCASFSSECCSPWSPFLSNSRNTLRSEDCRTQQRYKHRQWVVRNEVWFGRTRTPARPSPELKSPSSFSPRLPYGEPEPKRIPLDSLRVMGRVMRYWEGGGCHICILFHSPSVGDVLKTHPWPKFRILFVLCCSCLFFSSKNIGKLCVGLIGEECKGEEKKTRTPSHSSYSSFGRCLCPSSWMGEHSLFMSLCYFYRVPSARATKKPTSSSPPAGPAPKNWPSALMSTSSQRSNATCAMSGIVARVPSKCAL